MSRPLYNRKFHTLIYETIQELVCDSRHKVWNLCYKLSELQRSDINDIIHEAAMYVLNKDKLYNEIEKIIEDGGSFRGFLFNTLFIYLRAEVRKAYINKDAMYHAKTFSEWNDLLDKQVPFKKDRAEPFSSFGDEESIDTFLYHNGVYTPSSEDEVLNEEFRRSVADLLGQEITDGLLGGESQRQISKKTSIPQSTISDKIQKVRRNLKKNENN